MIKSIEIPALETASKIRAAIPDFPFIPEPETLIIAVSFRQLMPRIGPELSNFPEVIRVPRESGFIEFSDQASIPLAASGARVFGCKTFEPKKESSIASS